MLRFLGVWAGKSDFQLTIVDSSSNVNFGSLSGDLSQGARQHGPLGIVCGESLKTLVLICPLDFCGLWQLLVGVVIQGEGGAFAFQSSATC